MMNDLGPLPGPALNIDSLLYAFTAAQMEAERSRCYALGVAEERERCATLCEAVGRIGPEAEFTAGKCAAAIRGA